MGTQNKWAAMHINYNLSSSLRPLHALRKSQKSNRLCKEKSLYKFCFYTQANERVYPLSRLQNENFDYNYRLTASMSK